MAHHTQSDLTNEVTRLRPAGKMLGMILMAGGLLAIVASYFVAHADADGHKREFWFSYLFGLAALAAVSCASLIFLVVNHLVRAGWITNVRRILESFAMQVALVLLLSLPILVLAARKTGTIYSWAKPGDTAVVHHEEGGEEHAEGHEAGHAAAPTGDPHAEVAKPGTPEAGAPATGELAHAEQTKHAEHNEAEIKRENDDAVTYPNEQVRPGVQRDFDENIARKNHTWLSPTFWSLRVFVYLAVLSGIAWWYRSNSVKQDATGDIDISAKLSYSAGPMTVACGLITTFIAFDVFMSLDPHWFSTMYGIYFFASGTQAMWALLALFVMGLQARGYLKQSITTEHRHDIGKFLWAFIFFWGYVGFSQYMLQWYANMPEETFWFDKRGYSQANPNGYTPLVIALVAGRFIIPFLGLVSRHVKRNRFGLAFWAVWLLVFFVVDMYLLVLPEWKWVPMHTAPVFGVTTILAFGGMVVLWFGSVLRLLGTAELRPVRDPRVHESVALVNF